MQKLSIADELAQAMADNLKEKSDCPTTPDKITAALEQLSYAAQLFDTTGHSKYADQIDQLIKKLATPDSPTVNLSELAKGNADQGDWFPASDGTEEPFLTRSGRRLLYCWQPSTGRHAYLDMNSDLILSDEEAELALGKF